MHITDCQTVAHMQSTLLYQNGCNRTTSLIKLCLDDNTTCLPVLVCLELQDLSGQDDHLQKVINTFLCMCRYRTEDCRTAPVLWYELVFHQLLLYTVDIRTFLINFIDCNNDLDAGCFRMVDCLYGLWHNTIIGCNYKDCNIC